MMKRKDLTDQRFGKLVALYPTRSIDGYWYWMFKCDCGNTKELKGKSVSSKGHATHSCGCAKAEAQATIYLRATHDSCRTRTKDLFGQQFGRLTAVYPTEKRSGVGHIFWYCVCSCGNEKLVTSNNLVSGHIVSCGCYHRDVGRAAMLQYNADKRAAQTNPWLMTLGYGHAKKVATTRKHRLRGDR